MVERHDIEDVETLPSLMVRDRMATIELAALIAWLGGRLSLSEVCRALAVDGVRAVRLMSLYRDEGAAWAKDRITHLESARDEVGSG